MKPMKLMTRDLPDGRVHIEASFAAQDVKNIFEVARRILAFTNEVDSTSGEDLQRLLAERFGEEQLNAQYADGVPTLLATWVMEALDFETILQPQIVDAPQPVQGAPYSFKMEVVRKPRYELSSYEPVELKVARPATPEDQVDAYLEDVAETFGPYVAVERDRPVAEGDRVIADIKTLRGIEPVPSLTGENRQFDIGEGWFGKKFDDNVVGMRVGETRSFSFQALAADSVDTGDLETLRATLTVTQIQQRSRLQITDEWVQANVKDCSTVEEFRAMIGEQMAKAAVREHSEGLAAAAAAELANRLDITISDAEYEQSVNDMLEQMARAAQADGVSFDEALQQQGLDRESVGPVLMERARAAITQGYALDAWYRHFELFADDDDIDAVVAGMVEEGGSSAESLRMQYEQGGRMYILREAARRYKATQDAVARARIEYE